MKYENYFGLVSFFCLHLDDGQFLLSTSRRRYWLAIQGETTPGPSSIFNFVFNYLAVQFVLILLQNHFIVMVISGGEIDDHQRVATIIVPSLLQL